MAGNLTGTDSGSDSDKDWDGWVGDEGDEIPLRCLVGHETFKTVEEVLDSAEKKGLKDIRICLKGKGTYCKMKIINYVRGKVREGVAVEQINEEIQSPSSYGDEKWLTPVMEGDGMLFMLDEDSSGNSEIAKVEALEHENALLRKRIQELTDEGYGSFSPKTDEKTTRETDDKDYYYGYGKFDIHMMMLEDVPRTASYRTALMENPDLIKGKTVIDVGCGSGILSMFAARGGAKHVLGIDGSSRVADAAKRNIEKNNLSDIITVHSGFAEEVETLPFDCDKADVIVSEWMGYCLLYESMLDSVLRIRDKFLKPGGAILPDICKMYAAGVGPEGTHLAFWKNVWGFDMSPIAETSQQEALTTGVVADVDGSKIVTSSALIRTMDLATLKIEDIDYTSDFYINPLGASSLVASVVVWFDTLFSSRFCSNNPTNLTTSPYAKPTHWHHTLFHLPVPLHTSLVLPAAPTGPLGTSTNPASKLFCTISITKHTEHHRDLAVSLSVTPIGVNGEKGDMKTLSYAVQ
eukprot:TRINITY_DN19548_c0_g1_i1.p1 TRINITY_DN19548_c0_g1~~TRINITY_DN19548_c0_g1_i1.p1  ORF type:complete len:535 (+),score=108.52 TRINITY_DN19548_c0_g1_i1:46-1605(+)